VLGETSVLVACTALHCIALCPSCAREAISFPTTKVVSRACHPPLHSPRRPYSDPTRSLPLQSLTTHGNALAVRQSADNQPPRLLSWPPYLSGQLQHSSRPRGIPTAPAPAPAPTTTLPSHDGYGSSLRIAHLPLALGRPPLFPPRRGPPLNADGICTECTRNNPPPQWLTPTRGPPRCSRRQSRH
jgi:hypothetical protein